MTSYMKFREWVDASRGPDRVNLYTTNAEYWVRCLAMMQKRNPGWSLYLALETEEF